MSRLRLRSILVGGALWTAAFPILGAAQGAGATGFEVLQMPAGGRAAGLAGAYVALGGDADAIFYNPAGIALLGQAAALSFQRHVMDINLGSAAGAVAVGPVVIGAGLVFLDGGEVPEIVPDERFGGQRGRATGATVSARESAARLGVAAPIMDGRLHVGAAAGLAMSELAGISRSAPLLDLGVRGRVLPELVLGASLRNLGGSATGDGADGIGIPSEGRFGAAYTWRRPDDVGVNLTGDALYRFREESTVFLAGVEAGLVPRLATDIGAVLRVGYIGDPHLPAANAVQIGAGVSVGPISIDYAYQNLEHFGSAHRLGLRWRRLEN
jgi:hypothetical protein